jgi:hypothetical protein
MDTNTYKRYTTEQCLQKQLSGKLYKGRDSILHRDVMLYICEFDGNGNSVHTVIQSVKDGSQLPEERFMHVWDIEVDAHSIMIVLKPELGYFLSDELNTHSLTLYEMLILIRSLGQSMQEAAKDGIDGFSVYANNIWIQGMNQPIIINYWNSEDTLWSGAAGLSRLLYQLIVRTQKVPNDLDAIDSMLVKALGELPAAKKEAISKWVRAALQDRKSLNMLLQGLDQLLLTYKTQDEAALADKKIVLPVKDSYKQPEDGLEEEDQDEDEDDFRSGLRDEPSQSEPRKRMARKKKWMIGGIVVGALLVTEILTVQILRKPEDATPKQPSVTEQTPIVPNSTLPVTPVPAPAVPKPAADSDVVIVPNLKDLPIKEAGDTLVAAGLRYQYLIEANEQFPGKVFKQEPQANATAAKGSEVLFYVGK